VRFFSPFPISAPAGLVDVGQFENTQKRKILDRLFGGGDFMVHTEHS
jgi:hypothetical protein